jgi:hypothetical protein
MSCLIRSTPGPERSIPMPAMTCIVSRHSSSSDRQASALKERELAA